MPPEPTDFTFRCFGQTADRNKAIWNDTRSLEAAHCFTIGYTGRSINSETIEKYDARFYVGTAQQHPHTSIIVGSLYPPHRSLESRAPSGLPPSSNCTTLEISSCLACDGEPKSYFR